MPAMAEVTVTIVLYNSAEHLPECLEALRPELGSGLAKLVAVDNASPDDSATIVRNLAPASEVLVSTHNRGFAGGCNLAWRRVTTPYWLLLNPDVTLEPRALANLVRFMGARRSVGAVSPWLRADPDGEAGFPGRAFPSAFRGLLELTRVHRLLPPTVRARLLQGPYVRPGQRVEPDWIPATAMLVRADAVRAVGSLDESYFLYGEDLEWSARLRRGGWGIAADEAAVAVHRGRASGHATWSESAVEDRVATGVLRATAVARGAWRGRLAGLVGALSLAVEARHPRRTVEQRERSARAASAWLRAVRAGL